MHIYIKPQKRCDKCGHLVSIDQTQCPYCDGMSNFSRPVHNVIKDTNEPVAKKAVKVAKPIDPKLIKYGIAAVGVIALIITTIIIINSMQIRKSVLNPIDMEYAMDKNKELPGFSEMCLKVNNARYAFDDSIAYKEITYKRLYEFYHDYYNNSDFIDKIRQAAVKEHEEKYRNPQKAKLQSVLDEWEEYSLKHDVNNYLQINIITDYLVQDDYYDTYYRPKMYFNLSYPSGTSAIRDCNATLSLSYNDLYERVNLKYLERYNSPNEYLYMSRVDNSHFWDYYTVNVTINSVTLRDGSIIYANDVNHVPYSVKNYQDNRSLENEERVIKEFVNSDYVTQSEYVNNKINQELMAKDSLCCKFVNNFMN